MREPRPLRTRLRHMDVAPADDADALDCRNVERQIARDHVGDEGLDLGLREGFGDREKGALARDAVNAGAVSAGVLRPAGADNDGVGMHAATLANRPPPRQATAPLPRERG